MVQIVFEAGRVGIADRKGLDRQGLGRVGAQLDQLARHADLVGEFYQGLAPLGLFDFAGSGEQGVEVAEHLQKLGGGFDAYARSARNIVGAVARQGLDLDHLFRTHAELFDHLFAADAGLFDRVHQADPFAHQLHQVLVGRDDHHLAAPIARGAGIGGDQIIGLETRLLDRADPEGGRRLAHHGELGDQVLGRRRTVGLVEGVDVAAKGLAGTVEHDGEVRRRIVGMGVAHVADQLPQHVAKARDRPDRRAVRLARQRRQGVIGAENISRTIDEIETEGFCGFCGAHAPSIEGEKRKRKAPLADQTVQPQTLQRPVMRLGGVLQIDGLFKGDAQIGVFAPDHPAIIELAIAHLDHLEPVRRHRTGRQTELGAIEGKIAQGAVDVHAAVLEHDLSTQKHALAKRPAFFILCCGEKARGHGGSAP